MKAILINSTTHEVATIEINNWKEIAPAIGADLFACVDLGNGETLYVDDEGLLNNPQHFFEFEGAHQPFAGSGLILGTDEEGESVDTSLTVEEVQDKVSFLDKMTIAGMLGMI